MKQTQIDSIKTLRTIQKEQDEPFFLILAIIASLALSIILMTTVRAEDPPMSLALTAEEIKAGLPIDAELSRLNGELEAGLNKVLSARTDDALIAGARQWREAFKDRLNAQAAFNQWLQGVQTAHKCEGCGLDLKDPAKPVLVRKDKK